MLSRRVEACLESTKTRCDGDLVGETRLKNQMTGGPVGKAARKRVDVGLMSEPPIPALTEDLLGR